MYAFVVALAILCWEIKRDGLLTGSYTNALGETIPATWSIAVSYLVQKQPAFIFITLLSALMSVALSGFFLHHCYIVSHNITSYERAKRLDMVYTLELELADHPDRKEAIRSRIAEINRNFYDKGLRLNWREVLQ